VPTLSYRHHSTVDVDGAAPTLMRAAQPLIGLERATSKDDQVIRLLFVVVIETIAFVVI
jgi:hypothetical protein